MNCVDSKKTGTEHDQYRVRRARMKKRGKRAVEIKALPPLPLSLLPQSSSRSRVVWSRSCGGLLGSEAVVVEVDQEQLSQVEQTGLPVSWWSAPSMRNCATPGSKRHQDYSLQPALLNFLEFPQTHFIVTNPAYIPSNSLKMHFAWFCGQFVSKTVFSYIMQCHIEKQQINNKCVHQMVSH